MRTAPRFGEVPAHSTAQCSVHRACVPRRQPGKKCAVGGGGDTGSREPGTGVAGAVVVVVVVDDCCCSFVMWVPGRTGGAAAGGKKTTIHTSTVAATGTKNGRRGSRGPRWAGTSPRSRRLSSGRPSSPKPRSHKPPNCPMLNAPLRTAMNSCTSCPLSSCHPLLFDQRSRHLWLIEKAGRQYAAVGDTLGPRQHGWRGVAWRGVGVAWRGVAWAGRVGFSGGMSVGRS